MTIWETIRTYLESWGIYILFKHFYAPIPDPEDMRRLKKSEMVGIHIDSQKAVAFFQINVSPYRKEYERFPVLEPSRTNDFYVVNGSFMSVDSFVYYGIIRHMKPKKILEIGSGYSTMISAAAVAENQKQGSSRTRLTCIDPFPSPGMRTLPGLDRLIVKKAQYVPLAEFQTLQKGDILFIDSTHVLKTGGDVWWLYCEILPRLSTGVIVHVHDIELPRPYPKEYIAKQRYFTEQYVLQAFLTYNSKFEVLWPGSWMMEHNRSFILSYCRNEYLQEKRVYPYAWPSSFWMRVE